MGDPEILHIDLFDECKRKGHRIAKLEAKNQRLQDRLAQARELLKESRDELEHYIDQEYPYRHDYPHMMAKWDGSMDIVRRIDKALAGKEG